MHQISLPPTSTDDTRYWHLDPMGCYSVKSVYHMEMGFFDQPPHMAAYADERWWRSIWHLSILSKVKIFLQQMSKEMLASPANLQRHHVPCNDRCTQCGAWGTTSHTLIYCSRMKLFWKETCFWEILRRGNHSTFQACCEAIQHFHREHGLVLFETLASIIWTMICDVNHWGS